MRLLRCVTVLGLVFVATHCAVSFHDYPVGNLDASVAGASSSDASAGSGGSATGGSGGSATGGSGGSATGGSGGSATGGSGGSATGGSGGTATGGSGGTATGGSGGSATGGSGGTATGGSGGNATGGSGGNATGGSGGSATGGSGGTAGTDGGAGAGGTAGAAGSGGADGGTVVPPLLVSDGNTGDIYALDDSGKVLDQYTSPVSGVRGVAHDRRARDGFWVVGTGDRNAFYKLDWSGTLQKKLAVNSTMPSSPRGLDYAVDSTLGDWLFEIGTEGSPPVDDIRAYDVTGNDRMDGLFPDGDGGRLSGVWGIAVVGRTGYRNLIPVAWTTWNDNTLQLWSPTLSQTVSTSFSNLRGVDRDANGDFWVVAGTQIAHLDSTGKTLGTFAAPGPDPQGLSHSR